MKEITLTIDGVEYIARPKNETVTAEKPKTGYERADMNEEYFFSDEFGNFDTWDESNEHTDRKYYNTGNYYNDETLAENIVRADTLMRKLRQWQALNDESVDWGDRGYKFKIKYNYDIKDFAVDYYCAERDLGQLYFSSAEKAGEAIEVFKNDLTWYFTEYQQRLDEPNIIN